MGCFPCPVSFALRLLDVRNSSSRGDVPHRIESRGLCVGWSSAHGNAFHRLGILYSSATRGGTDTTCRCFAVARRINSAGRCPATERGPAARRLLRESCRGSHSASFADLPERAACCLRNRV